MVCRGLHWFVLKIPRGDAHGVGEDELTVTSGLHAQAERTKKQRNKTEKRKPHPLEAQTKVREAGDVAQSRGSRAHAPFEAEGMNTTIHQPFNELDNLQDHNT